MWSGSRCQCARATAQTWNCACSMVLAVPQPPGCPVHAHSCCQCEIETAQAWDVAGCMLMDVPQIRGCPVHAQFMLPVCNSNSTSLGYCWQHGAGCARLSQCHSRLSSACTLHAVVMAMCSQACTPCLSLPAIPPHVALHALSHYSRKHVAQADQWGILQQTESGRLAARQVFSAGQPNAQQEKGKTHVC